MPSAHRIIWNKLGVHRGDSLPFGGSPWTKSNRVTLVEILKELNFTKGAEVGVEKGKFSEYMLKNIPNLHLICVDPWAPYHVNTQDREDRFYEETLERLKGLDAEVMRMPSIDASRKIANNSLDFVYIDALHDFDSVMVDMILWYPKVRTGGVFCGHDFFNHYQFGVIDAVRAFTVAHNVTPWYITNESIPNWLWVKE